MSGITHLSELNIGNGIIFLVFFEAIFTEELLINDAYTSSECRKLLFRFYSGVGSLRLASTLLQLVAEFVIVWPFSPRDFRAVARR